MSKLFDRHHHRLGWHSPYGYANFGFKQIKLRQQYRDRDLYGANYAVNKTANKAESPHKAKNLDCRLVQGFVLQKAGNHSTECEDIWDYYHGDRRIAIALADGATESSFAKEWAGELVRNWVGQQESSLKDWMQRSQISWRQWLGTQELSWFAKRKAAHGAFATFLSLRVLDDLSWQAHAVGDSCLFLVRDRQLCQSFPLHHSHEFSHRPQLLGSDRAFAETQILQTQGSVQLGDRFYLTTDAIACWILRQLETRQNPWVKLEQIQTQELFVHWVSELRDRLEIANDDTTLLCLEVVPSWKTADIDEAP